MAGFDAGSVVEPLNYTFEPHVKGAAGTIREPTDAQLQEFYQGIKTMLADFKGKLPEGADSISDPTELMGIIEDLDFEVIAAITDRVAGIYSGLCSDHPSKAQILKLPPRIRNVFFGWLQQEVMSPEVVGGGGNAQVLTLPPAAAAR